MSRTYRDPEDDKVETRWGCAIFSGCFLVVIAALALYGWWALVVIGLTLILLGLLFYDEKEAPK